MIGTWEMPEVSGTAIGSETCDLIIRGGTQLEAWAPKNFQIPNLYGMQALCTCCDLHTFDAAKMNRSHWLLQRLNYIRPNLHLLITGLALFFASPTALASIGDELRELLARDGSAEDRFGKAVGISGNTAIVGAWWDGGGSHSGSAYLFDTTTGSQLAKLTSQDAVTGGEEFGISVGISSNIAVVGAHLDNDNGFRSGSAFLFDVATGALIHKLLPNDGATNDYFGRSVSISGNVVIVGSPGDDDNHINSGSAYLFDATTGAQLAKLTSSDSWTEDGFGSAVGISGNTAIVGAYSNDNSSGSAYLFTTTTGVQLAKLKAKDAALGDMFGISVGISGGTVIVGANEDDDNGFRSGSAYLFDTATGAQLAKLTPNDGAAFDEFGVSVGITDSVAIVGAISNNTSGSAYLFDVKSGSQLAKLTPRDGIRGDQIGLSVGISGNIAIVGAQHHDHRGTDSGSAYLFATVPEPSSVRFGALAAGLLLMRRKLGANPRYKEMPASFPRFTVGGIYG
jgi:hypothetical protein